MTDPAVPTTGTRGTRAAWPAFAAGAAVGLLGGLIGLGGAEFRLPLLISVFGFAALQAVMLNKVMSLLVVATALPARLVAVPYADLAPHWPVVLDLLVGSVVGAWLGASWATRMTGSTLHRVLAALLVLIAAALVGTHTGTLGTLELPELQRYALGVLAGLAIGAVAALMGVAGGELLIPTLVLLHGIDLKTAGSLSLAISLPTMLVALARYRRDSSWGVVRRERRFLLVMAAGSVAGTLLGGLLLGVVPTGLLVPLLAGLLLLSARTVFRHA